MAERQFTELELKVLDIFFTGVKGLKKVYCAKATLPSNVWGFLTGAYSRSSLTMREKLLDTFDSIVRNEVPGICADKPQFSDDYVAFLEDVAMHGSHAEVLLNAVMSKADKFLSTWAVGYGHSSLKDSCSDRFAVEGVSILATKMIEWATLGAYQEKSTRYADFSKAEFVQYAFNLPENIRDEAVCAYATCMSAYSVIFNTALEEFYEQNSAITSTRVRGATSRAQAFDVARYLLPVGLSTSLGITSPSRETERIIRELLSSDFNEGIEIGLAMLEAASEINPSLIKHVSPTDYDARLKARYVEHNPDDETLKALKLITNEFNCSTAVPNASFDGVNLYCVDRSSPVHPAWMSVANFLRQDSRTNPHVVDLASIVSQSEVIGKTLAYAFSRRRQHDAIPHALDTGSLIFEGYIDFGAYRDVQRHRNGHQMYVQPHVTAGYDTPAYVESRPALKAIYDIAFQTIEKVRASIAELSHLIGRVEYFTLLGHRVLFTYECTLAQAMYMIELRTGPSGHISYRTFCQAMAKCLLHEIPELTPHLRVDWSTEATRQKAEENTERKLASLSAEAVPCSG